jgi:hypothetical protein
MAARIIIRGTVTRVYNANLNTEYGEVTHGPVVFQSESLLQFDNREVEISIAPVTKAGGQ